MPARLLSKSAGGNNSTIFVVLFFITFAALLFWPTTVNAQAGSIDCRIFEDLNFNNSLDAGEILLSDWQVNLYRENDLISSQSGQCRFFDLNYGKYRLELTAKNGWFSVSPDNIYLELNNGESRKVDFGVYQISRRPEGIAPVTYISNEKIEIISPESVKITWFTNYPATGQIVFGKESVENGILDISQNSLGYQSNTNVNWQGVTYHAVVLTGLDANMTYCYRIVSLPDPTHWRGASKIFSGELTFNTPPLSPEASQDIVLQPAVPKKISPDPIAILSAETETDGGQTGQENYPTFKIEDQQTDPAGYSSETSEECPLYITILLFINLIPIYFIRSFSKKAKKSPQQAWWISLIVVAVPLALGYPECWLTIWLIFTFILEMIYLSGFKKRSEPPGPSYPGSDFGPFSNID